MYQMAQGAVDTSPIFTICLHRSKNKSWLSSLTFLARYPLNPWPSPESTGCGVRQRQKGTEAEPGRRGDTPTIMSYAGIESVYSPGFADANAYVHVDPRPLRVLRFDSRLRHQPFNQMSSLSPPSIPPTTPPTPPPPPKAAADPLLPRPPNPLSAHSLACVRANDDDDASTVTQKYAPCVDGVLDHSDGSTDDESDVGHAQREESTENEDRDTPIPHADVGLDRQRLDSVGGDGFDSRSPARGALGHMGRATAGPRPGRKPWPG